MENRAPTEDPHRAEDPHQAWTREYCLRPYNPYMLGGATNPAFVKALDGRLLDFKEGRDSAVNAETEAFRQGLANLDLPNGTFLVVVPGHEARASNEGQPLARVASRLAEMDDRYVAGVDSLIRTITIPKKAGGGNRDIGLDLNSMCVTQPTILKGAVVVLLDDTVTTGGSIAAARQLLSEAGAKAIAAVALARTVKYF